jgi:hypothetical protein
MDCWKKGGLNVHSNKMERWKTKKTTWPTYARYPLDVFFPDIPELSGVVLWVEIENQGEVRVKMTFKEMLLEYAKAIYKRFCGFLYTRKP